MKMKLHDKLSFHHSQLTELEYYVKCKDIITIYDAYNIISMEFHQLKKTHKKQSRAGMTNLHSPYDQMSMNLICIFYAFLTTFFRLNFSAAEIRNHTFNWCILLWSENYPRISLDITISGIIRMRVSIIVISPFKVLCTFSS